MIRNVAIDQITVSGNRRTPQNVEHLAESIRVIGLLNPITVTRSLRLVAGGNRLAAFKVLGKPEIPAHIVNLDDLDAELAEIDENLIRNELTVLERGEQLARRKEIYEAKYPETRSVNDRGGPGRGHKKTDEIISSVSFADDTAAKLNVTPRTIQQEIQIAESITEEAKELIRGTDLEDHKADLLNVSRVAPAKQTAVIKTILSGEAKTVAQAKRAVEREEKREALEEKVRAIPKANGDDRSWEIALGNCVEKLAATKPGSARLIFADPPYNIGIKYGDHYDDTRPDDEFEAWCGDWIRGCFRTLADDGSLWLLINHEWSSALRFQAEDAGFHLQQWITWYESFGVNTTRKFNRCSRAILWLVKDPNRFVFNGDAEQIRRPSDRQAIYGDSRADPFGKLWDDVWGIKPPIPRLVDNAEERVPGFPTQLPLALLRPIVACASSPGDLVVDPFNGSGTTGAACIELGRRYLGIELSERFADLARKRLIGHEQEHRNATR